MDTDVTPSGNTTTSYNRPGQFLIMYVVGAVIVMTLIIFNNSIIVVAVTRFKWLRNSSNTLLLNLAVADLLAGLGVSPLLIALLIKPKLTYVFSLCMLRYGMMILSFMQTSFMLICLSVDRYVAVAHPLKYPRIMTRRVTAVICCFTWSASFALAVPSLLGWNKWHPKVICTLIHVQSPAYIICIASIIFCLMLVIISLNARVFYLTKERQIRLRAMLTASLGNQHKIKARPQAAKTLLIVTSAYVLLSLPNIIIIATESLYQIHGSVMINNKYWMEFTRVFGTGLCLCNSFVNPIIYHYNMKEFKVAFRALLHLGKKDERQAAIQNIVTPHRYK